MIYGLAQRRGLIFAYVNIVQGVIPCFAHQFPGDPRFIERSSATIRRKPACSGHAGKNISSEQSGNETV